MKNQKGFSAVEALIILVIVGLLGFVGWHVYHSKNSVKLNNSTTKSANSTTAPATNQAKSNPTSETWTRSQGVVFANTTSTDTHKLANNLYRMYLMNQGQIYYTESTDGSTWGALQPTGIVGDANQMISNPAVVKIADNNWLMIYEQSPGNNGQHGGGGGKQPGPSNQRNLLSATSTDGKTFTKAGVAIDSSKSDGYFASVPDLVLLPNDKIRMYYVTHGDAIGSAVSADNGKTWTEEAGLRLDNGDADPDVLYNNGVWVMYYSVLDPSQNQLQKAYSTDGLQWTPLKGPVVAKTSTTADIVDPDVVQLSATKFEMFFGESATNANSGGGQINLYKATYDGNIF